MNGSTPRAESGRAPQLLGLLLATLSLASCATIREIHLDELEDPWAEVGAGDLSLGVGSGWAFYSAEVEAEGTGGALFGETGTDRPTLTPRYGGAVKLGRYFTDDVALGLVVEHRNFEADPVMPLDAELVAQPFSTNHFLVTGRWFLQPMGPSRRIRPFLGLDLGYVPEVDFGPVDVNYPDDVPSDRITIVGSDYWTLAPVVGASYMLQPGLSLDIGAFYEFAVTPGEDTLVLPGLGGATVDVEVWAEGLILFFGVNWIL